MAIDSAASLLFEIKASPDEAVENIHRFRSLFSSDLSQLKTQIASWSEEVFGEMATVKDAMLGLSTAAAGALVALGAALFETAKKAAEMGEEMGNLAQTSGIPVQTLSGLKVVSEEAGISFDTLTSAAVMMARQLSPVASSSSTAGKALQMLGLSAYDSKGHMKDTISIMAEVADKFKVMQDGATKTALAQSIFSRSGAELIPILDQGGAALRGAADKAKALGLEFDDLSVEQSRKFLESMRDMKFAATGVAVSIGQDLMPVMTQATQGITNFTESSADDIRDFAQGMGSVLHGIGIAGEAVWDTFEVIGKGLALLVDETLEGYQVVADAARGHFGQAKDDLQIMRLMVGEFGKEISGVFSNMSSSAKGSLGDMVALGKALDPPAAGAKAAAAAADKLASSLASVRERMQSLQDQEARPQAAIEAQYERQKRAAEQAIQASRTRAAAGKLTAAELAQQEKEYSEEVEDLATIRTLKLRQLESKRVDDVAKLDSDLQTKLQTGDKNTLAARLADVNKTIVAERAKYASLGALDTQHEQMIAEYRSELTLKAIQAQAKLQDQAEKNFEQHFARLKQITDSYVQKSLTGAQKIRQQYLDEVAAIKQQEAELLKLAQTEQQRQQAVTQAHSAITAAQQDEERQLQQLQQKHKQFGQQATQVYNQLDNVLRQHSKVAAEVMQEVVKALMASLAAHQAEAAGAATASAAKTVAQGQGIWQVSVWQAALNMAKGIADLADFNFSGAVQHFAASGAFAALAASVGAAVASMVSGGGSSRAAGHSSGRAASGQHHTSSSTHSSSSKSGSSAAPNMFVTIQGVISTDNLTQVMGQMSGLVSGGQSTLTASHMLVNGATVPAGGG